MQERVKELGSKNLTAKVTRLIDLVDYQESAVVSRTIIDKKTGTVTSFAFDEEQRLSEHTAPSRRIGRARPRLKRILRTSVTRYPNAKKTVTTPKTINGTKRMALVESRIFLSTSSSCWKEEKTSMEKLQSISAILLS